MTDFPVEGTLPSTRKTRSLFATLCGIVLFVLCLLLVVGGVGGCYIISQVNRYTSAEPAQIPQHDPRPREKEALLRRIKEFETAAAPAWLELTADDLNVLTSGVIGNPPSRIHTRIHEGKLIIDASIRLGGGRFLTRFFEGRFLNVSLGLELAIHEGRLRGRVTHAVTASGERIQEEFLPFLSYEDVLGTFLEEGQLLPSAGTARTVTVGPKAVVLEK
jgi:hypothetical protein